MPVHSLSGERGPDGVGGGPSRVDGGSAVIIPGLVRPLFALVPEDQDIPLDIDDVNILFQVLGFARHRLVEDRTKMFFLHLHLAHTLLAIGEEVDPFSLTDGIDEEDAIIGNPMRIQFLLIYLERVALAKIVGALVIGLCTLGEQGAKRVA